MSQTTQPHYCLETERAVLSSCIQKPELVADVQSKLSGESAFFVEANRILWNAILAISEKGLDWDSVSLVRYCMENNLIEGIGGHHVVSELELFVPSTSNIMRHVEALNNRRKLRLIKQAAQAMAELSSPLEDEIGETMEKAQSILFDLDAQGKGGLRHAREYITDVVKEIQSAHNNRGTISSGLTTGFKGLDKKLNGMKPGELIIFAGRPSMGKTSFAMNIGEHVALDLKKPVAIFSMEMTAIQLVKRMACSRRKLSLIKANEGWLNREDMLRLSTTAGEISRSNLWIDDTAGMTIGEIRSKARQMKMRHDLELVIVDYVQLVRAGVRTGSRELEVGHISSNLKEMAKELKVPVIALAQLSREPEKRPDKRPLISDLRESGTLEQDADVVVLLFRKYYYTKAEEDEGIAECVIGKNRDGPTGTVNLSFMDEFVRFSDAAQTLDT